MDLFEKAYSYDHAEQVMKLGLYPYFRVNQSAVDTTVMMDGRKVVMVGSNNYLGLTSHPEVKAAAIAAVEKYGSGCTGSRFLNGTIDLHVELEERLAKFMQKEAALVFSTGFTTNQGVISTLVGKNDVVISDRTNHASILDGCRLSFGKLLKFRHNDMADLERILVNLKDKNVGKLIVVDGVFSMEGDLADLQHILPLAKKYGARVMVDEAHGVGVLGKNGRGACEELGVLDKVDLIMGTFSKSFASLGGFVAGDAKVIHFLKHNARAFIFQASPPPASVAAALAALTILEREPERRERLMENVRYMLARIRELGFQTYHTQSAIIPIVIGDDLKTFQFAKQLLEEGVYVNPVVSPAVPPGMGCLRTSYTATHTREELDFVLEKLKRVGTALNLIGPNAPGAPVQVLPVGAKAKRKKASGDQVEFLKFPWSVYASDRNWVPPLITEVETVFDSLKNVFYQHGRAQAFVAKRGDTIVGRIVAAIDDRANELRKERAGFFGFFEVDKDYGAAAKLLDAAREWLTEHGVTVMRGPQAFSLLDGQGCLVEGFDQAPAIMTPYNPAYYSEYLERYGFQKARDFYAFAMDSRSFQNEAAAKLDGISPEDLVVRHLRPPRFRQEMRTLMDILNDANAQDPGFSPLSGPDLKYLSAKLKPVIEKELVNFVEVKGKPVAFAVILPDYNEVLKRFNGRIGITDMLKFYLYSKTIKRMRFTLLGVRKEFQGRGLEALLYRESLRAAREAGYTSGELSWIPEDNVLLNQAVAAHGGKRTRVFRWYAMNL